MKFLTFLVTAVLLSSASYGQADYYNSDSCCNAPSFCCQETSCCSSFTGSVDYAAFIPLDSDVVRIYGTALPQFAIEGNWRCDCYGVWLNASYVFANGHVSGCGNKTHLNLVPITLGVKYYYQACESTSVYFGLGATYSFLNTKDHSDFVHKNVSSNGFGGIVRTGIMYTYCENVFFEGFLNYTYQRFTFSKTSKDPFVYRHDANLSSLQLGVGIGMKF